MSHSSIGHIPTGKWAFDEKVTDVFDDMLARSIPQYELMRSVVTAAACEWATPRTTILDIGCSRGEALARVVAEVQGPENYFFTGVEVSPSMRKAAEERFRQADLNVPIHDTDLRYGFPAVHPRASVVLSVLTLQFVPIEYRQRLVRDCYEALEDDGAMIVVEKVLGDTAQINKFMVDDYHELKAENGYSGDEIERKRLSLEGVLVPVTAKWNEELLRSAGFRQIDCIWRYLNFAAWVALR